MRRHIHKFIKTCIACACATAHFRFVVTLQSKYMKCAPALPKYFTRTMYKLYVNHILI